MRNNYPGVCYRCGQDVLAGEGHFERSKGGWRVQHADCAIRYRGTDHHYEPPKPQTERLSNMAEKNTPSVITLGPGLIRWPHLFEPFAGKAGWAERFGATIVLRAKEDIDQIRLAMEAATTVMKAAYGNAAKWKTEGGQIDCPIVNGASSTQDGCGPGTVLIAAYCYPDSSRPNNNAPSVVDLAIQPILDRSLVYDGMKGYVAIDFYVSKGYSRVNVGLKAVQKTGDGPVLGNVFNPKAAFKAQAVPDDAVAGGAFTEEQKAHAAHAALGSSGAAVDPMAALGLR